MLEHFHQDIHGWFNFREIYAQAISEATDGAKFAEVGSWCGKSAAWMAVEIANSGKQIEFYSIDTWRGSVDSPWMAAYLAPLGGSCKPVFMENMRRGGVAALVTPIEMLSVEAATLFADESLDFVFIDAAHDYESVRADIRAWYPKVKPGGVIAGDDADWPGVLIGIRETISESEYELRNCSSNWWHRKQRREYGTWHMLKSHPLESDYLVYIPYVNNRPLLEAAVQSVKPIWPSLMIIDQSELGLQADWEGNVAGIYRVPFGSISFSQMMNWARNEAVARKVKLLVFMHNDAECVDLNVVSSVIEFARTRLDDNVGVTFTNYDALAAFNVQAIRDVGPWDESFRWYFADNDYYLRMSLCGWQAAELGCERVKHLPSQTLQTDERIRAQVQASWSWHERHYEHKWGGRPGSERFSRPYNGAP